MTPNTTKAEVISKKKFSEIYSVGYNQGFDNLKKVYTAGVEAGKREILKLFNHDREKLLDGFAHPKDCESCLSNNPQDVGK